MGNIQADGRVGTALLNALPDPVLTIDPEDCVTFANMAAEQFLCAGAALLHTRPLSEFIPSDNPLFALINQARSSGIGLADHGLTLESPRIGRHEVAAQVTPLSDMNGEIAISLHQHAMTRAVERQLSHRGAARSVSAMAALMAHEVKNPLSGIRGAAQLLERSASQGDRQLTRLICDETDRIVGLIERMEAFSEGRPLDRMPVNIHRILNHVCNVARAGFGRSARFTMSFDPSLPPAFGNHDALVQLFLNLVKNAVESCEEEICEIDLATKFQHGLRVVVPGTDSRLNLPMVVSVRDNGPGIPDDMHQHLFEPFVSTKNRGSGLGLALVAKVVQDHGAMIEFDSTSRGTVFRVMLPIADSSNATAHREAVATVQE